MAENVTQNLGDCPKIPLANAMIPSRVPSPNLMVRLIRIALAALLVSIVVAPYASAQQELTFPLFERYLDALRVQANIPGMSAAIVQDEHVAWATGLGFATSSV